VDGLLTYSLFSMGYYLGDLVDAIISNNDSSDFWEMLLHHILTITLFGGMILQNQMRVGVIVSFIHNATDIMSNICRGSTQTNLGNFSLVTFFLNLLPWVYFRNIALPVVTWACWTMADFPKDLESFYPLHY
jgi:hypothetical protein